MRENGITHVGCWSHARRKFVEAQKVQPKGKVDWALSTIGKAPHYLQGQWPRLTVFLEDGRIPLDNSPAENAIRPFVVGRKNWLFSHTLRGAHASATIYSLLETAKANGLEPYAYLVDVLKNLPAAETDADISRLLPWNWGETIQA